MKRTFIEMSTSDDTLISDILAVAQAKHAQVKVLIRDMLCEHCNGPVSGNLDKRVEVVPAKDKPNPWLCNACFEKWTDDLMDCADCGSVLVAEEGDCCAKCEADRKANLEADLSETSDSSDSDDPEDSGNSTDRSDPDFLVGILECYLCETPLKRDNLDVKTTGAGGERVCNSCGPRIRAVFSK